MSSDQNDNIDLPFVDPTVNVIPRQVIWNADNPIVNSNLLEKADPKFNVDLLGIDGDLGQVRHLGHLE